MSFVLLTLTVTASTGEIIELASTGGLTAADLDDAAVDDGGADTAADAALLDTLRDWVNASQADELGLGALTLETVTVL